METKVEKFMQLLAKLKITTGSHVMSPEQWIASVMRMEKIRESKS